MPTASKARSSQGENTCLGASVFRVWGSGLRFRFQGLPFRVQGLGSRGLLQLLRVIGCSTLKF